MYYIIIIIYSYKVYYIIGMKYELYNIKYNTYSYSSHIAFTYFFIMYYKLLYCYTKNEYLLVTTYIIKYLINDTNQGFM